MSNAPFGCRACVRLVHTTPAGLDPEVDFEPLPMRQARCADGAGTLAPLFSDEDFDIARAKVICTRCEVRVDCLAKALERREAYGVWGGTLLVDGEPVRFAHRRGRPARTGSRSPPTRSGFRPTSWPEVGVGR